MSKIQGKPFIELVVDTLGDLKTDFLDLVNGSDKTPEFRSLINASAKITGSDKGKVQYVVLETWSKTYTGYLIYNNTYCVLVAFSSNTQALTMLKIDVAKQTFTTVKEYLDINELRRLLQEANDHIVPSEIDSTGADNNQVLTADGNGGAYWSDKVNRLVLVGESGTLTAEQLAVAQLDSAVAQLGDNGQLYYKNSQNNYYIIFKATARVSGDDTIVEKITIDVSDRTWSYSYDVVAAGESFTPTYDDELSDASTNAVQNKVVTEALEQKANVDGNYPTLTAGLADNLNTKIVQNEKEAYLFRTTGGSLEVGNNCKEKGIIGGSIGFNQLFQSDTPQSTGEGGGNVYEWANVIVGHKYLLYTQMDVAAYMQMWESETNTGSWAASTSNVNIGNVPANGYKILTITTYSYFLLRSANNTTVANKTFQPMLIDLTAMFGSTIADYIYSLEQGEAGAGVAWFKRYFNKPYYPYTAIGAFINVKTSGKKVVGFNQFNQDLLEDVAGITKSADTFSANQGTWNTFNLLTLLDILPNQSYCFRVKLNPSSGITTAKVRVEYTDGTAEEGNNVSGNTTGVSQLVTNANKEISKLCITYGSGTGTIIASEFNINFHYDGERDGEYEPYESETYTNDDIELIGIPKIDAQGNLYYEGNIYRPDGTVEKKFAIVDLGTLDWGYTSDGDLSRFYTSLLDSVILKPSNNDTAGIVSCAKYPNNSSWNTFVADSTKNFALRSDGVIGIRDSAYTDAATFKTAMSGVYLVYELATPTEDSATPYPENQPCNNWGTEERIDNREVPIPVGHDTDYPLDLKSKLEILPNLPSDDGVYVCKVESGTGEYVALGSWLVANGYEKQVDLSDQITDLAGLTYDIKKLSKIGNQITLSIRAFNNTGSTIAIDTELFRVPSGCYSSYNMTFNGYVGDGAGTLSIKGNSGAIISQQALDNNKSVQLFITYII